MKETFRTIRCWLIAGIVCSAAMAHLWFWRQTADLPLLARCFFEGKTSNFGGAWRNFDELFATDGTTADLAVQFPRFAINDEAAAQLVAQISHRGSFSIYPRRVITAEDGARITDGKSILSAQFFPTAEWLKEHNIEAIFTITLDETGTPVFRFDRIRPKQGS